MLMVILLLNQENKKKENTMKKIFIGVMALVVGFALFSCEKENSQVESSLDFQEEVSKSDEVKGVLYTATSEVGSYNFSQDDDEGLRANVRSKGYQAPKIDVSAEEFKANGTKAYWSVVGQDRSTSGVVSNFLSRVPEMDQIPSENTLVMYQKYIKEDRKRKRRLKVYAQVDENFDVNNEFAMLALDGEFSDGSTPQEKNRYINYKGTTAPNNRVKGLRQNQSMSDYHLPIMTDILPFDKVFRSESPVHYKPRGVIIVLKILNSTCKAISLKNIVLEKDNALWFEGAFDTYTGVYMQKNGEQKEVNLFAMSSAVNNPPSNEDVTYKSKFIGSRGNEDITCPISGSTPSYRIQSDMGNSFDYALKNAASTFYIWGYPKDNSKKLKFKIRYTDYGETIVKEKSFAIDVPKNKGFQDGYAYRLPVYVTSECVDSQINSTWETPLDFVSEMPGINKAGDDFVKHHCPPSTYVPERHRPTDIGYYSFQEARNLFNGEKAFLNNYYLPSKERWTSIISGSFYDVVFKHRTDSWYKITTNSYEYAQVGDTSPESYQATYFHKTEVDGTVATYAIRFKETEWESAWYYSFDKNLKRMVIKCVSLKGLGDLDLERDIARPEFFLTHPATIRVFPPYGVVWRPGGNTTTGMCLGEGKVWTDTPYKRDKEGYTFDFDRRAAWFSIELKKHKVPVRPFYKVLPKK